MKWRNVNASIEKNEIKMNAAGHERNVNMNDECICALSLPQCLSLKISICEICIARQTELGTMHRKSRGSLCGPNRWISRTVVYEYDYERTHSTVLIINANVGCFFFRVSPPLKQMTLGLPAFWLKNPQPAICAHDESGTSAHFKEWHENITSNCQNRRQYKLHCDVTASSSETGQ